MAKKYKRESDYQADLIKTIKKRFPDSIVMKNDPNYIQGIPDLCVLHKDRWALLEAKKSKEEPHQPNQDFYVGKANDWSYGAFIFPENEEEVLNAMERIFEA